MGSRFVLNDAEVDVAAQSVPSGLTVLDFIRQRRRLTGTKEGCKEGDCGACVVLVGALEGDAVRYLPMTSCMMPVAEAAGKHVVTIEGLGPGTCGGKAGIEETSTEKTGAGKTSAEKTGTVLNTVQREIVAAGASQCGFCTPGIVVSLVGRLMHGESPAADGERLPYEVDRALSGHLCRCTGYRSLRHAATVAFEQLEAAQGIEALVSAGELAPYFRDIPGRLRRLAELTGEISSPAGAAIVGGGTDLYVQRGEELPVEQVVSLGAWRPELGGIELDGAEIRVGALATFEDLAASPMLRRRLPAIEAWMDLIASWQIRTRSTVGGNLINASPIGDVTVLMLALGARAVLEHGDEGTRRSLPLEDLYLGYKQLDRRPGEILAEVRFPDLGADDHAAFEKVSKRRWLDIATVNAALRLRVEDGFITRARAAAGGVAPVPLFLRQSSALLVGRPLDTETLRLLLEAAQDEISPISDVRGSADYKRRLVHHLLVAQMTTIAPGSFDPEATYQALFTTRRAS